MLGYINGQALLVEQIVISTSVDYSETATRYFGVQGQEVGVIH